jgi:hypothetical protein
MGVLQCFYGKKQVRWGKHSNNDIISIFFLIIQFAKLRIIPFRKKKYGLIPSLSLSNYINKGGAAFFATFSKTIPFLTLL